MARPALVRRMTLSMPDGTIRPAWIVYAQDTMSVIGTYHSLAQAMACAAHVAGWSAQPAQPKEEEQCPVNRKRT